MGGNHWLWNICQLFGRHGGVAEEKRKGISLFFSPPPPPSLPQKHIHCHIKKKTKRGSGPMIKAFKLNNKLSPTSPWHGRGKHKLSHMALCGKVPSNNHSFIPPTNNQKTNATANFLPFDSLYVELVTRWSCTVRHYWWSVQDPPEVNPAEVTSHLHYTCWEVCRYSLVYRTVQTYTESKSVFCWWCGCLRALNHWREAKPPGAHQLTKGVSV